jgi:DNA mismatch repair protein MutS2
LLNRTEQDLRNLEQKDRELRQLMKENERLKAEMEKTLNKEKHRQQLELLREQNRISAERISYLKEMERKLRQIVVDWRKAENKQEAVRQMQALLFHQKEKAVSGKVKKKFDARYMEVSGTIRTGDQVKMRKNHQVGRVREIRGKKAVVQVGLIPITLDMSDLVLIRDKPRTEENP